MLYRCNAQGVGGCKSSTLLEEELGESLDFQALCESVSEMKDVPPDVLNELMAARNGGL